MNSKSPGFFTILEEKLIGAGIPDETAKWYARLYKKGLAPELSFENDEMPSDDCFKTLKIVNESIFKNKSKEISRFDIKRFLSIPYGRVESAQDKMVELFPDHASGIFDLYKKDVQMYYVRADEAEYLYNLISDYFPDSEKRWDVFKLSIIVGEYYTESRFEAVEEAVGKERASEVIYEATVNGFLLHPYYTDPVAALKYLRTMFDEQTTAKIILENPYYLYLYKDEYYVEFPEQREEREKQLSDIVSKYL